MSFFDKITEMNPFKKKEDFSFAPLDEAHHDPVPNLEHAPQFESGQFAHAQEPQHDPRMQMPFGETLRQPKVAAMYGHEEPPFHAQKEHNPLQKDLELISSKLDYLKASLESINQRLVNLEHMNRQQIENKKW
jgi:hypothetical protein